MDYGEKNEFVFVLMCVYPWKEEETIVETRLVASTKGEEDEEEEEEEDEEEEEEK